MPNTIAHLGVHCLITRGLISNADFKWIFIGAVLPDVPFIIKRAITVLPLDFDILDVRLFSIVQASLAFSVLLGLMCAQFSRRPGKVFLILCIGVVSHLLLDACQIKWGNGPRILAPFDWSITNFSLFWPEELPSHLLSVFGIGTVIYVFAQPVDSQCRDLIVPDAKRWAIISLLLMSYFSLPLTFLNSIEQAGGGSVDVIRSEDREGQEIKLDRARFVYNGSSTSVELYSGKFISLLGLGENLPEKGKVSVKGTFTSHSEITVREHHFNNARYREIISIFGLLAVMIYWIRILAASAHQRTSSAVRIPGE
ncbi:MAG: metal-dependent hydrolase [Woeseia sp.]|jgi:hypothetical protein|nr:metal-dependent hydrolase [Woeseia sp.]